MKIQMGNWFVNELKLVSKQPSDDKGKDIFSFSYGSNLRSGSNKFQIAFKVNVENSHFTLTVGAVYNFTSDVELRGDFQDSDFLKVNAPAIAFPYLRAFISMITMQSGYQCVILPSINFVALAKQAKEQ